ncbi:unnamed protein product [Nezara viridula]|uniref:U2A'/phosphoprotein 32 family A C-terminal domain-containing protein n=1 Tax=Nezara viridula TaxID=85310 RepID=A0A9P0MUE6_NEZVI|nr:unnamed protein product [Nezara viridula]
MEFSSWKTINLLYPSFEFIHSKIEEAIDLDSLNTNLKSLVIIGEPLYAAPDISRFKLLEDLWLVECSLHIADQVQYGKYLRYLHLSSNALTKIPNLVNLRHLKKLWLPGNSIERIYENELPPSLEDLNVAENRISTIQYSFQNCCNLETLNISANPIQSIFELCHLTKLKRLKNLWLCDPLFELTALTKLVNYRAFVINCLPNLKRLDFHSIDEKETELSKLFFVNKHNHYKMLSVDATYNHYLNQEEEYKNSSQELQKLKRNLYILSLNEEKAKGKEDENTLMLIQKLRKYLNSQIKIWQNRRLRAEAELEEHRKLHIRQIEVELANFGNIKFKMHNKNSCVARTCERILNSFICNHLKYIIDSIEVLAVTQVLRAGQCSLKFTSQNNDWTPEQSLESLYILCEPLYVQDSYEPFFNYVQQSLYFQVDEIKYTISQCIGKADSSSFDQICNLNKDHDIFQKRILSLVYMDMENTKENIKVAEMGVSGGTSNNNCILHNVAYELVANPILLVEFKYFKQDEENYKSFTRDESFLLEREPYLPSHSASESLFCNSKSWGSLSKIVVRKLNLRAFGLVQTLPNVKELDASYNKLICLREICHLFPNLEVLEASFNDFSEVPTNYSMPYLCNIDLSWNLFSSLYDILKWIRRSASSTTTLILKFNCFMDINDNSHEECLVFRALTNLTIYNGAHQQKEPKTFFKLADISTLPIKPVPSDLMIPKHLEVLKLNNQIAFTDLDGAQIRLECEENSIFLYLLKDDSFIEPDAPFTFKEIISCSVMRSQLETTHFLKNMKNLRELNLSFNLLVSMERNLPWHANIVKLNLSCNYIKSLADFKDFEFPNLKFLDVSKNRIEDCFGIKNATNIEEFNVSFNYISELDRFLFLKCFRKLRSIDIRRNGIEQMDTLKRYLIYHVRTLEYINGFSISESEVADAHTAVGGVLDNDYLESVNKNKDLKKMKHLNLVNASIRLISLTSINLDNLVSVNLDNNTIESIAELLVLENLKYLSLAGNQISKFGEAPSSAIFYKLEELHLNKNSISNLEPLKLHRMPKLKTLFLQDNCITSLREHGYFKISETLDKNSRIYIFWKSSLQKIRILRESAHILAEHKLCRWLLDRIIYSDRITILKLAIKICHSFFILNIFY